MSSPASRPILSLLALAFLVSGCVNPPPPKEVFYRFDPVVLPDANHKPRIRQLRLEPIRAQGILSERALLFTHADSPTKLEQYRYHHWSKPPALLLYEDLELYLRAAKIARQVIGADVRADAQLSIDGELMQLERVIKGKKERVRIEVQFRVKQHRTRKLLLQQRYSENEVVEGQHVAAAVHAMSRARQRILDRLLSDLKTLPTQ